MPRFFNVAGPCNPDDHYMLPSERRVPGVRQLVEQKLYFVIHAARQTGKTTTFRALAHELTREGRYAALHASCEMGQSLRPDLEASVQAVVEAIGLAARRSLPEALRPPAPDASLSARSRLRELLGRWAESCPLPVVLFLDEIDALYDDALISVLRQLRDGYPSRPQHFPQSMALIGLRDVRDYKIRARDAQASLGTSSPFNIKVESITLRNFTAEEVAELYAQHTAETGQRFTPEACALAFELTQGQPWLVNALARQAIEKDVRDRTVPIEAQHIEAAKEALIERRDTHLDSLVDRLREPRVRRVIEPILAGGLVLGDRIDDDIAFVEDLGLVRRLPGRPLEIANPIYREVIPRALSLDAQASVPHHTAWYVRPDGTLDFEGLLGAFVEFWREHAEALLASQPYHEVAAQLVFLAFLQRIVNGGGFVDREYGVGAGRLDVCVRWPHPGGVQREAVELKLWRPDQADPLSEGLRQLSGYLTRLGLGEGTLAIFDRRPAALPLQERCSTGWLEHGGRRIRLLRL